ncbi:CBP4-domain-containing protein [Westerdykella ornata]|uniref:Cytochrome b mRNA-processing protein 4 n=1 Tax=Westerdykella ornata TaxID=318751 RepID=A0A6A6JRP6_WESOR|nr:CBP4-domain-containing protein [Westerdykella ornata]KAF2277619.1 CBP4-domain-containing protein [Westerdykella ornata]
MPGPGARTYLKALAAGAVLCIGGPMLVNYVTPTEEEIFKKYNPELQKRALETREQRQQEFDDFVMKLKEASKSNKPIWGQLKEIERKEAQERSQRSRDEQASLEAEAKKRRAEIRSSA